MSKTQDEIAALKQSWMKDPCWDIEDTEGFEEYKEELLAFHKEQESKWAAANLERERSSFEYKKRSIEQNLLEVGMQVKDWPYVNYVLAREQVKATLLLAEQVKRVGDLLAEKIEEDESSRNQQFTLDLHKILK